MPRPYKIEFSDRYLTSFISGVPLKIALLVFCVSVLGMTITSGQANAQDEICTPVVTQAMAETAENCGVLERNSACYGSESVEATFASDTASLGQLAARTALTELTRLDVSPINLETEQYGVAVINVQANIPVTTENDAVKMVLLGDVTLDNAVSPDEALLPVEPVRVVVTSAQRANLRGGPTTSDGVVAVTDPRDILMADGQNAAGDWLRVIVNDGEFAWISSLLVAAAVEDQDELEALPVVAGAGGGFTPVQNFYFSTGLSLSGCADAPDLLIIQTPDGIQANLTINGLEVEIGSSAALFSTDTFFGDLLAYGIMEAQLLDANIADDVRCLHTRLVMLDGNAALGRVRVPTGHLSQWVTCLDDDLTPVFLSEVTPPGRLSRDELAFFGVAELISDELLHTAIVLPSEGDIDLALAGPQATPTRAATARPNTTSNTAVPRPTSANTGGDNTPAPTAVPATPVPSGTDPDCSTFRATSPFGVVQGQQPFYWDGARNVNAYQVAIVPLVDGAPSGPQQLFRTGANNTSVTVGIGASFPGANGIRWYVQALVGSEPNFTAVCETPAFDNPIG